ncbi:DUF485 domain-containing protein [Aliarcobacter cibarius]|jgi:uncharacterized membrane protein (DUF485 family)|uniref:DUF485 domain-containing protein n=2 Tax=Aliarcobacter cibarius TaxID=255507 RepID=A0ABY2V2K0_9BACT|nr:DUF485 domain-containing protein [Aliarcobacter cibarius]TLS97090.1 DUF485 domain-containing protein [Aliarcobacter cibarius]TLS98307.1 DUF485 domain-containing protein [Aliarcobacter cibarius]
MFLQLRYFTISMNLILGEKMNKELVERIKANPKYTELITKRSSFAIKLAIFMLVVYYGFVLVIAFNKEFFATKVGEVMTVAWPIAVAIILIAFITTVIYVLRANGEFEDLEMSIKNDVKDIL